MDAAYFEKLNRIRLEPVLLKARTEIPPLVTEAHCLSWQAFVRPSTRRTEIPCCTLFSALCALPYRRRGQMRLQY